MKTSISRVHQTIKESIEKVFKLANSLLLDGKIEEAIDCYRTCIQQDCDFTDAYFQLAEALQKQGKLPEATFLYRRAITLKAKNLALQHQMIEKRAIVEEKIVIPESQSTESAAKYVRKAEALLKQGNTKEAIANCRLAVQTHPNYALAYKVMGNVLQTLNRVEDAKRCYTKAIEIKPDFAEAHANLGSLYAIQQQWQEAIASYQKAISLKPDFAGAYRNLAQIWEAVGNTAQASACHERVLSLEPKQFTPEEHLNAGNSLVQRGKMEEAISCYRQAIQLNPNFTVAYQNLGEVYAKTGNLNEALNCYRQASQIFTMASEPISLVKGNSNSSVVLNSEILNLGDTLESFTASHETIESNLQQAELHMAAREWQKALSLCQRVIQIKPDTVVAYKMLGNIMQSVGKIAEARQFYSKALQIQPMLAEVHANLGSLYVQQQQWQQAVSHYQAAIRIKPDFVGAYRNMAKIWEQLGKFGESAECRYKALQLEPATATPEDLTDIGNILFRYGTVEAAIAAYRQAIQINANFIGAYFNLAAVLTQQGELAEANACYRKAMELNLLSSSQSIGNGQRVVNAIQITNQSQTPHTHATDNLPHLLEDPDVYLHLAESYLVKQKYKQAIAVCKQLLAVSSISAHKAEIFRILGIASQAVGQWKNAEQYLQAGIKLQPRLAKTHDHLGNLYSAQKQWQKAALTYEKAIEIDPQFADAYRHLAGALMQLGQQQEGAECWYKAFQLAPNWATPENYLNLGNLLLQQNQVEKATNCYRKAVQLNPRLSQAHHNLGEVLSSIQDWDNAIAAYRNSVLANSHNASSHYGMGKALAAQGKYTEAVACYRKAIHSSSSQGNHSEISAYIKAYESMGEAFSTQDEWEAAMNCYQEILELVPENTDIQNKLEQALDKFGSALVTKGNLDEAVALYQGAIAFRPTAQLHHQLADVLSQQQNYQEAAIAYQAAINLNPDHSWSHNNLGDALKQLEKWEEAATAYREAINLNPDFVWSHYNLGETLTHLGDWDSVITAYRQAITLQPDLPYVQDKLGNAFQQRASQDRQSAADCYRQAIEENPDDLQNYHRAIDITPNDVELYIGLANALVKQGNSDGAIAFYQIALQLQPEHHRAKSQLEELLKKNYLIKS